MSHYGGYAATLLWKASATHWKELSPSCAPSATCGSTFFSVVPESCWMGFLFRLSDKREMLVSLFTISLVLIAEMF